MDKIPCIAVDHALCVTAYGGLAPCCATWGVVEHLDDRENIEDYWYNSEKLKEFQQVEHSGEWPKECEGCRVKSLGKTVTRKEKFANWYKKYTPEFTEQYPKDILHMDISFGNTCSQQCIMCNSNFSSKWLKDDLQIQKDASFIRNFNELTLKNWSLSYDQLDQIANLVTKNTKIIEIKGGEPLYDKRFEYFVNAVLEKNSEVRIHTNTNGIHFNKKTIEVLNKIKRLNIDVSFDGTGKIYEWIRSSKWEDAVASFEYALEHLHHTPNLNYTTMMYNVDHFLEYYNWAGDLAEKYNKKIPIFFTQVVTTPKHFNPKHASKSRVKEGIKQIEYIINDPRNFANNGSSIYEDRLTKLLETLNLILDNEASDRETEKSIKTHEYMTKIRGWDIRDYTDL